MDFPLLYLYLTCSLLTTIAFLYLIFHFFITNLKRTSLDILSTQQFQSFNDNIEGLITKYTLTENKQNSSNLKEQSPLTSSAKKIINLRKQRNCCKDKYHRQCCFLLNSGIGLLEMKLMNKKYIKNSQKAGFLGLVKQKKKKNLSYCVKKYGFHKTALVTIYEQLQY